MAEVALIGVLVPKIMSLLEGGFKLRSNMRSELLMIKNELEYMKAFLMNNDYCNSTNGSNSLVDEVWVKQVRELAFDSEDIVDELMLDFAKEGSSVRKFLHSVNYVSRIKEIRSRVVEVRESNKGYRRPDHDLSLNFVTPFEFHNPQQDAIFNDDELVGREMYKMKIIHDLQLRSDTLKVISVTGTGGVGKTSLVKKVYDDEDVKKKFERRAWISVSQAFRPDAFFKNLIGQLQREMKQTEFGELGELRSLRFKQEVSNLLQNLDKAELQQMAKEILQRGRYLVVLDDIWTIDSWNAIRNTFPDSPDSKVLITTRIKDVALSACGNGNYVFHLTPLSDEDWLHLFCKNTPYDPKNFPEQLAKVTKSILNKCAGIPLAIVAVRGILFTKKQTAIEWEKVSKNLGAELDSSTKRVLSLGYTDLPYYLKPCYLYLSIFPEDHKIEKNRLIRLWISEGFVVRKDRLTCEQVAESYLNELVQRNLIQVADTLNEGIIETYCIHDLLREIIINKAENQVFSTVIRDNEVRPQQARRLSVHGNLSNLEKQQNLGRLRSLFMFEAEQPSAPSLFSKDFSFKMLTVLDMQGTTTLTEFPKNIMKLRNLKYLNLSHTDLKSVPSSICSLVNLETLDLRYTYVTSLPSKIVKLQRLHSLLVYQHKNGKYPVFGVKAPAGIGRLHSLRSLFYVNADSGCGNVVKQLAMLTQLTRLGIANFSNENAHVLSKSLHELRDLQAFSLSSSEAEEQALDLQHLVFPSKSLQCLYLTAKLESFPSWITSLQNLEKLFLRSCKLQTSPLEALGTLLPNLVQLELVDACTTYFLKFEAEMFQKLRILDLHELEHLEFVIFELGTLPNLERFRMVSCQKLWKIPDDIVYLSKLTSAEFVNMPSKLLPKAKDIFEKMVHIKVDNWVYKDQNDWKIKTMTRSSAPRPFISNTRVLQGSFVDDDDTPPNRRGRDRNNIESFHTTTTTDDLVTFLLILLGCLLFAAMFFVLVFFDELESDTSVTLDREEDEALGLDDDETEESEDEIQLDSDEQSLEST